MTSSLHVCNDLTIFLFKAYTRKRKENVDYFENFFEKLCENILNQVIFDKFLPFETMLSRVAAKDYYDYY